MAFNFGKYGTFTGPSINIDYRDNDDFSTEPFEGYFNLNDVSMVLVNTTESPADYVYLHLAGTSTSTVTLERSTGPIPTFKVEANQTNFSGEIKADGEIRSLTDVTAPGHRLSSKKNFDIRHPNKEGWRLRHTSLEGPENGVYFRGKLEGSNVIELPGYWKGFVDPESITVSLTQIGYSQDLIVEKIEWGSRVIIKSGTAANINCYYVIHGTRMDGDTLVPEYPGLTPSDYPGDNREYIINGN